MVWFQCEDCGEDLKKPKLPSHFRICSATKLSCIDCGEMFGQQSVQGHTQCITEAEKYGPKGQGRTQNGATPKSNKDTKQKPEVDVNVGLSDRPPWFCSLCNTNATSKQTLLLHADGKKHRAKARAFHAAKQPKQTEESAPKADGLDVDAAKNELSDTKHAVEQKKQDSSIADGVNAKPATENGKLSAERKRKVDAYVNDANGKVTTENSSTKIDKLKENKIENVSKKSKHDLIRCEGDGKKEIKWKKIIKSALKSNDGALKMKKLKKLVLKSLHESGHVEDDMELSTILDRKINSSSRYRVDGKYVYLVAKA